MAGERTPDTSPPGKPGSSDDEISLREHLQRQLDMQRQTWMRAIDDVRQHYDEVLREREVHWTVRVNDITRLYDERYERQLAHTREQWDQHTHATETAFRAASAATDVAFAAANRSIESAHASTEAAIGKVERASDERYAAQATALLKADAATEKRFDAVNEFRGQLSDQAATFMPRSESEVRIGAVTEKLDANSDRINKLELRISSRLDIRDGQSAGSDKLMAWIFAAAGFVSTVVAIGFALANRK